MKLFRRGSKQRSETYGERLERHLVMFNEGKGGLLPEEDLLNRASNIIQALANCPHDQPNCCTDLVVTFQHLYQLHLHAVIPT